MKTSDRSRHEEDLIHDDGGQGLVEYAIIIALIAVVCIVGVRGLGNGTRNLYSNISTSTNTIGN